MIARKDTDPSLSFVVAHYHENLDWYGPQLHNTLLYTKSGVAVNISRNAKKTILLPNIGRESHTYLYHIVHSYENLSKTTIFTQGDPIPHVGERITVDEMYILARRARDGEVLVFNRDQFALWGCWDGIEWATDPAEKEYFEKNGADMFRADLTPGEFWQYVMDTPVPLLVRTSRGATFAVTDNTIRARPLEFYKRILNLFEGVHAEINPEISHYVERIWLAIFADDHVLRGQSDGRPEEAEVREARLKCSNSGDHF